jgi:hypothetical protein
MSIATEKISVGCAQCGQQLVVPASAAGKQGRCPTCKHVFPLDAPFAAQLIEPSPPPQTTIWDEQPAGDYTLQPLPPTPQAPINPNPYAPPATTASKGKYQHGFGLEHRGWDAGMMGGLTMMAIAALWLFVGLYFGRLFFYPVILFIIGLVGFFRGLFTGNIVGR